MTGTESRLLHVGARVCWAGSATDLGTVTSNGWDAVVINWDDGRTSSVHHNDMGEVTVTPKK